MMNIENLKNSHCLPHILVPRRLDPKKPSIQLILHDHFDNLLNDPEVCERGIRPEVLSNLKRARICGTPDAGYSTYACPNCKDSYHYQYHTCKSRFCSSCGVKYALARSKELLKTCLGVPHRHVTFTIPQELRTFFRTHYQYLSILSQAASDTLKYMIHQAGRNDQELLPGIICVLHTFGRDLKWNPHVHVLVTEGGADILGRFHRVSHFPYKLLRKSFMKTLLDALKKEFPYTTKNFINKMYLNHKNGLYVNAPPHDFGSIQNCITYVSRYMGRPVIGNRRILAYDGEFVTWYYDPHDAVERVTVKEHAVNFLKKLIIHIPPKQFKMIRYYGLYAPSLRKHKFRKHRIIKLTFKSTQAIAMQQQPYYRRLLMLQYNVDPIKCTCGQTMEFISASFP